jgi:outer membrane lipoprotein-sorting protein
LSQFEVTVKSSVQRVRESGELNLYSGGYKLAVHWPNRFRRETEGPEPLISGIFAEALSGPLLMVGNESSIWIFTPALNRYGKLTARGPGGSEFEKAENWVGTFVDRLGASIGSATPAGEEKLRREADIEDCWILDAFDLAVGGPVRLWVDKSSYFIVKERINSRLRDSNGPLDETVVDEFTFSRINSPIPDEVFILTPPVGAKREDFVPRLDAFPTRVAPPRGR